MTAHLSMEGRIHRIRRVGPVVLVLIALSASSAVAWVACESPSQSLTAPATDGEPVVAAASAVDAEAIPFPGGGAMVTAASARDAEEGPVPDDASVSSSSDTTGADQVSSVDSTPAAGTGRLTPPPSPTDRPTAVEVVTPWPPAPVQVDDGVALVYELHVTNFSRSPLAFRQIDVLAPGTASSPLATFADSGLIRLLAPVGEHSMGMAMPSGDVTRLEVGRRTIVYLWVTLQRGAPVPTLLRHRLSFAILDSAASGSGSPAPSRIDSIDVPVTREAPALLSPPLHGGDWLAGDAPSNTSTHRRSITALRGKTWIAQRFAIDWQMVGSNGNTFHDKPDQLANWWGYGQPVYAAADGEVTQIVDGIPDNTPRVLPAAVTLQNIAGNYVIVRAAPHRYMLFAHLQPGSIRVHLHEHLRRGDRIALLGNSGNSTAPHLHFQVMDSDSPLAAEGLPFVFGAYTFLGFGRDFEEDHHPVALRRQQMPIDDPVVRLP